MRATAELLAELAPEVVVAPEEGTGGYVVALVLGQVFVDLDDAEAAADEPTARLTEALKQDLAAPLRVPAERLALPS